jgi:hypothetical protein
MNHVIAVYQCDGGLEGPTKIPVSSARDIANFVFKETQRSLLEETELFALDKWAKDDTSYHLFFVVKDLEWFEIHVEDILFLVARDFKISVDVLENVTPLLE